MFFNSASLIIDDKKTDGDFISSYLNKNCIPSIFYQYDPDNTFDSETKKISGIRTIFQDLSLLSSTSPTKSDFDAAASIIENILDSNNGPWLLVTWSTWVESDSDSDFPKDLFEHLQKELPISLRPFDYITINKSLFTHSGNHDSVMSPTKTSICELHKIIRDKLKGSHGLRYLFGWEETAKKAVYSSITELTNIVSGYSNANETLHKVIENIARSATGKSNESIELNAGVSDVLSDIVKDKIENQIPNNLDDFDKILHDVIANHDLPINGINNWKESINKAIHFDMSEKIISTHKPGMIYNINDKVINSGIKSFPLFIDGDSSLSKFKRVNFFSFLDDEKGIKNDVSDNAELICLDITPPCDHANKKAVWNKYMVGIKINSNADKYCKLISTINTETGKVRERDEKGFRLINDSLVLLPKYTTYDGDQSLYRIVLNAKLIFSISTDDCDTNFHGLQLMRVRENLLSDIRSWFIRQATRPGIVELRS